MLSCRVLGQGKDTRLRGDVALVLRDQAVAPKSFKIYRRQEVPFQKEFQWCVMGFKAGRAPEAGRNTQRSPVAEPDSSQAAQGAPDGVCPCLPQEGTLCCFCSFSALETGKTKLELSRRLSPVAGASALAAGGEPPGAGPLVSPPAVPPEPRPGSLVPDLTFLCPQQWETTAQTRASAQGAHM